MAEKNRSVNVLLVVLLIFCILNFGLCVWLVKVNFHRPPAPHNPIVGGPGAIFPGPDLLPPPSPSESANPNPDKHLKPKGRRHGPEGHGRGPGRGRFQSTNAEYNSPEIREVFQLLAEYYPEWQEMLEQASQNGREGRRILRRKLWKYWPKITKLAETYKYDPELARKLVEDSYLRNQADKLAREYHRAKEPAEKERIKQELTEILSQQFEVRQWIRERKLSNLEKRISQLRKELQQRIEKRDELIQHQLKLRIAQEAQEQNW